MRVRLYHLSCRWFIDFLRIGDNLPEFVSFPVFDLPVGATVHHSFYDPASSSLGIFVEHDSFDDVPDGATPPTLACPTKWRTVPLKNSIDSSDREELLLMRETINERLYDLDHQ